ncbi:MAG: UDP-4-amino-4,6-dideoxy-N-acetyl-beta-L-altrosamine N-acetyltransferase [candidate division Zixibacteria bacterium]|nr:UDP-4-amino-4,6-dideoxy-N-acetyl-beta-L-altrosamine N-acetyltransferase [candidate division Zixibacteria bacterium]MDH3938047.1 UDP-4-amino-4,6-dideoxy-N-acetyl-beta-L-altrosamine N-acetyltransferase [candidate division Zixibacteria bacterium]MDH4033936.1 UDP-4-amino-4,6-dideoxy-N-acetyl-beta-L-altrosamine N-acetyltransferase [candidate division Zixibacteria bacterium]
MPQLEDYKLRRLREDDLPTVLTWRNSQRIRANMYTDHIITNHEHRDWYRQTANDDHSRYPIIEYKGQPMGLSYFTNIDRVNGTCMWGFYVGDEEAPRGTGTVLGFLSMNFIFVREQLREVGGEALAFNVPSQKLFNRLGFSNNGCRSKPVVKNGSDTEVIMFSLQRNQWLNADASRVRDLIANRKVKV